MARGHRPPSFLKYWKFFSLWVAVVVRCCVGVGVGACVYVYVDTERHVCVHAHIG